jgi:adenine phosphoribosyltransferase
LRKRGKLPGETYMVEYALEYGTDAIEMHRDALTQGERTMMIDDLIATGGTAMAAAQLLRRGGAEVVAAGFIIDLPDLGGADKLRAANVPVSTLIAFPGH